MSGAFEVCPERLCKGLKRGEGKIEGERIEKGAVSPEQRAQSTVRDPLLTKLDKTHMNPNGGASTQLRGGMHPSTRVSGSLFVFFRSNLIGHKRLKGSLDRGLSKRWLRQGAAAAPAASGSPPSCPSCSGKTQTPAVTTLP